VAFPDDLSTAALWADWERAGVRLVAPLLLRYAWASVLCRYQRHERLSPDTVRAALDAALALPVAYASDAALHRLALQAASRYDLPAAYDAHYVALAERESAQLCTADARLARHLRGHGVDWVRVPGE
jgi:predicted nucleic acid-binding protein